MKLYIMKTKALEVLKDNLPLIYVKYFTEPTNKWIEELYGENPFIEFKDVPEFSLAPLDADLAKGEIDLRNCKILYEKLMFLSESQACDERLWAGLTHSTFYDYMRRRWGYGYGKKPKTAKKEAGEIKTRFFYQGSGRGGFYRNTLSKCWWVGHNTYDPDNTVNHFEKLDIIGSNDISTKISDIFHNNTFASNPYIFTAIVNALKYFKEENKTLQTQAHIRPALQYLNAVGGSVVIDCLEQDEITDIFINAIESIMQGDKPSLSFNDSLDDVDDLEDDDTSEEYVENMDESEDSSIPVTLGCKVMVRDSNGKTKVYKYDYINGSLPKNIPDFKGLSVGDSFEFMGNNYKIEDISI